MKIQCGVSFMNLQDIIKEKQITKYKLAKISGVSQTTINDICTGKVNIKNCTGETLYKLAKALDVSIEELLRESLEYRPAFETFKSNICHYVKDMGDIEFLIDVIKSDLIYYYIDKKWYLEALYLLGMVDYLCRENNMPLPENYKKLRNLKLSAPIFPTGIVILCSVLKSEEPKEKILKEAIPEFLRHNIVENEVRNVA